MPTVSIVIDDADSWFRATVKTTEGETDIELDLYESYFVYARMCEEHADDAILAESWRAWLMSRGVPRLSNASVFKLASEIVRAYRAAAGLSAEEPTTEGAERGSDNRNQD